MTSGGEEATELRQHVVVVGADTLSVRLVEELVRAGEQLVVIAFGEEDPDIVDDLTRLGARVITATRVREEALIAAGVRHAKAAVILADDDVVAVRIALAVEELNPSVRLVIEMGNPNLGERLAPLLGECTVLSSADLAAPAFVAAALASTETQTFEIGGRMVAAGHAVGSVGTCWPSSVTPPTPVSTQCCPRRAGIREMTGILGQRGISCSAPR